MKRWRAVTAAVLAAGIAITAAGVATPGTARASTPGSWYRIFHSSFTGSFEDIAAISKTNVWAVGELWHGSQTVYTPYIQHFNGSTWKEVTIPGAKISTYLVQATSASNVWVVGYLSPGSFAAAYRWDGARWHKIPVPASTHLRGMAVLSPSNVWAFGDSANMEGQVWHWNGRTWQTYPGLNINAQSISASSSSNVWVAAVIYSGNTPKAYAYRWDGSRWLAVKMPHPVFIALGVEAFSSSDVWIGWINYSVTAAVHWNGQQWHQVTAPSSLIADSTAIVPDGRGGQWWGPRVDYTGHAWVSHLTFSPGFSTGFVSPPVQLRGTSSFLAAAGVSNTNGSSMEQPAIFRFDLR
jgi:hypothetical protein